VDSVSFFAVGVVPFPSLQLGGFRFLFYSESDSVFFFATRGGSVFLFTARLIPFPSLQLGGFRFLIYSEGDSVSFFLGFSLAS
jgi:hypothetical protein